MYALGLGVDPDPVEAWKWHTLSKHQGLSDVWLETRLAGMSDAERKRAEDAAARIEATEPPRPLAPQKPRASAEPPRP
jgi:TPR repeat protein